MFELTLDYKKEQNATRKAIDAFQTFIEKYPGDKKYLSDIVSYSTMNINTLDAKHILGYFALKKIEGDKPSNDFLKKLIDNQLKFKNKHIK